MTMEEIIDGLRFAQKIKEVNAIIDNISFCQLIAILYGVLTVISVIRYGKKEITLSMIASVASMALDRWLA